MLLRRTGLTTLLAIENLPESIKAIIPDFMAAGVYMGGAPFKLSMYRRNQIYPVLKPEIHKVAKESKMDKYLFGENLMDKCKTFQTVNKSAIELKASTTSQPKTNYLNWPRPKITSKRVNL